MNNIRKADLTSLKAITTEKSRGESDTLIYVVNYEDEKGYALVAARAIPDPVIAVVPEGNFDPEAGTDNPGLQIFLDGAKEMIASEGIVITPDPGGQYIIENGKYVKYESQVVTHWGGTILLGNTHHWDQFGMYGQFCPNGRAGCGPLAAASMIVFLNYWDVADNLTINYTYPDKDIASEELNWIQIYKHKRALTINDEGWQDEVCYEKYPGDIHKTIGRLCRQIGFEAKARYYASPKETLIYSNDIIPVFKKYLPKHSVSNLTPFVSYTTMKLFDHGLLYMYATSISSDYAHAWVCDGYDYQKIATTRYESDIPDPIVYPIVYNWKMTGTSTYEVSKNHMVWGKAGSDDGWYSGSVYQTSGERFENVHYISVTL